MTAPPAVIKDFATPPEGRLRRGPFTGAPIPSEAAAGRDADDPDPGMTPDGQEYEPFSPNAGDRPAAVPARSVVIDATCPAPVVRRVPRHRAAITAGGLRLSVPVAGVEVCRYGFAVRMSEDSDGVLFEPTVGTEVSVSWGGKDYAGYYPGLAFSLNGELVLVFVAKEA